MLCFLSCSWQRKACPTTLALPGTAHLYHLCSSSSACYESSRIWHYLACYVATQELAVYINYLTHSTISCLQHKHKLKTVCCDLNFNGRAFLSSHLLTTQLVFHGVCGKPFNIPKRLLTAWSVLSYSRFLLPWRLCVLRTDGDISNSFTR